MVMSVAENMRRYLNILAYRTFYWEFSTIHLWLYILNYDS
jgi:hypothetical protein